MGSMMKTRLCASTGGQSEESVSALGIRGAEHINRIDLRATAGAHRFIIGSRNTASVSSHDCRNRSWHIICREEINPCTPLDTAKSVSPSRGVILIFTVNRELAAHSCHRNVERIPCFILQGNRLVGPESRQVISNDKGALRPSGIPVALS